MSKTAGRLSVRPLRQLSVLAAAVALSLATVVLVRAFDARRMGPLKPWLTVAPASEVTARDLVVPVAFP